MKCRFELRGRCPRNEHFAGSIQGPLIIDHSHMEYFENETLFDPDEKDSIKALIELSGETDRALAEKRLIIPFLSEMKIARSKGLSAHDTAAPLMNCDYRLWQRRFKELFDPNDAADSSSYIGRKGPAV